MKMRNFVLALAVMLLGALAMPVMANGNHTQSGGYGVIGGGFDFTTGYSTGKGNAGSDAAGGGEATSGVKGTGLSTHYNTGYDHSTASSAVDVGLGYANTSTSGSNTAFNYSAGADFGAGKGKSDGASGGDFSSVAKGTYHTNYVGAQGDLYLGYHVGGYNVGNYGGYDN